MVKVWEAEFFALNFVTGEMESVTSNHYFEGVNFEEAQWNLVRTNMPWLRLTGNWFRNYESLTMSKVFNSFLEKPSELVEDMDYDEFNDWLDLGTKEDVEEAIKAFEKEGLTEHIKVMKVHLKIRYGESKEGDKEEEG